MCYDQSILRIAPPKPKTAVCVCGTYYLPDQTPTPLMQVRLHHAFALITKLTPSCVIASGGKRGTRGCRAAVTEAHLIAEWFKKKRVERIYQDDLAEETVGNLVFTYIGLLSPLGVRRAIFVTDEVHADRLERLGNHILGGLIEFSVSASGIALPRDLIAAAKEAEHRGRHFADEFINEVPPNDPVAAFEWIADRHRDRPYPDLTIASVRDSFLYRGFPTPPDGTSRDLQTNPNLGKHGNCAGEFLS